MAKLALHVGIGLMGLGLAIPAWASDGAKAGQATPNSPQMYQYTCKHLDAQDVQRFLTKLLPDPDAARVRDGNTIRVTGSASTIALAKDIIHNVDVASPGSDASLLGPRTLKRYTVAANKAAGTVLTLRKSFKSADITAAGNDTILVYAASAVQDAIARQLSGRPSPATSKPAPQSGVVPVTLHTDGPAGSGNQLVDPASSKESNGKGLPVTITALGNKLYIHSDDPDALKLVQDMTRLLTTAPSGKGDFEIIHLKNGSAEDVAKILENAFNGPKEQTPTGPAAFFMRMRGIAQPEAKPPAIRVVADPASNCLLVQASPLNMLTIRRLLGDALDAADNDSNAVMKTFPVRLLYAEASDVAAVVKDVYKEHMNSSSSSAFGFGRRARFAAMLNNANKQVTLTVGVDERTNSVILNCSQRLYDEIKELIDKLDMGAAQTTPTVRIIPVFGVDPTVVQQTLDAMEGLGSTSPVNNSRTAAFPGGMMMGGFGGRGGGGRGFGGGGFGGGRGFGGGGFGGGGRGFGGGGGGFGGGGRGFGGGGGGGGGGRGFGGGGGFGGRGGGGGMRGGQPGR